MRVLCILKIYFAPFVSYPPSPSLPPTVLTLSLLRFRFRFSFPVYIFLSLCLFLSVFSFLSPISPCTTSFLPCFSQIAEKFCTFF